MSCTQPLVRDSGVLRPATWDEALALVPNDPLNLYNKDLDPEYRQDDNERVVSARGEVHGPSVVLGRARGARSPARQPVSASVRRVAGEPIRFGNLPTMFLQVDTQRVQQDGGCVGVVRVKSCFRYSGAQAGFT